jgi:hypothetical protein
MKNKILLVLFALVSSISVKATDLYASSYAVEETWSYHKVIADIEMSDLIGPPEEESISFIVTPDALGNLSISNVVAETNDIQIVQVGASQVYVSNPGTPESFYTYSIKLKIYYKVQEFEVTVKGTYIGENF